MSFDFEVLIAAYPERSAAGTEFDQLVELIRGKQVVSEGAILVERDEAGELQVRETGDRLGRKGMGWGGGVGVLVGLAAPPLLGAVAVGAAAGGLIGKFAGHKVQAAVGEGLGANLKPGMAAVMAVIRTEDRLVVEQTLAGSPAKSVAPIEGDGLSGLKEALAVAIGARRDPPGS